MCSLGRQAARRCLAPTSISCCGGISTLKINSNCTSTNHRQPFRSFSVINLVDEQDHYQVLNVKRTASTKQIRAAYFEMSKRFHPDSSNQGGSTDKFHAITEAYSVLSNPEKRRDFDRRQTRNTYYEVDKSDEAQQWHRSGSSGGPFSMDPKDFDFDFPHFREFQRRRRQTSKKFTRYESHVPPEYWDEGVSGANQKTTSFYRPQSERHPHVDSFYMDVDTEEMPPKWRKSTADQTKSTSSHSSASDTQQQTASQRAEAEDTQKRAQRLHERQKKWANVSDGLYKREREMQKAEMDVFKNLIYVSGAAVCFLLVIVTYSSYERYRKRTE